MTLLFALLTALVPQDETRLKEGWPQVVDAWKAIEALKPALEGDSFDDEIIKILAKTHAAFEAAGLTGPEGEYAPRALKQLIKARVVNRSGGLFLPEDFRVRARTLARQLARRRGPGVAGESASHDAGPVGTLVESLKTLDNADDADDVLDEHATAIGTSLTQLRITGVDTGPALRRRAIRLFKSLAAGGTFPEIPPATEDQAKQIRAWIADLGHESMEIRDKAAEQLHGAGEKSLPFLREGLKTGNAEAVARLRRLLGIGHAPWKIASRTERLMAGILLSDPASK